jgi:flagellar basal body-associated protein FliL
MCEQQDIPKFEPKPYDDVDNTNKNTDTHVSSDKKTKKPNKKQKKKVIIPILIIVILGLLTEGYFFFIHNKDFDNINSYNHWFGTKVISSCIVDNNIKSQTDSAFYNQICTNIGDLTFVSAATNIKALSSGATEAYTFNYKTDIASSNTNENAILFASVFNDKSSANTFYQKLNSGYDISPTTVDSNLKSAVWQNGNAVFEVFANDPNDFESKFNL